MVISYKKKFVKVFLASLILGLLSIVGLVWTIKSIYSLTSDINAADYDYSVNLLTYSKFLVPIFGLILLVAEVLYIYSHYLLAKAKGYSAWLTLLGLLNSFIGLIILFLLPDKRKSG